MHFPRFDGIITYWNNVKCFITLKCILRAGGWHGLNNLEN